MRKKLAWDLRMCGKVRNFATDKNDGQFDAKSSSVRRPSKSKGTTMDTLFVGFDSPESFEIAAQVFPYLTVVRVHDGTTLVVGEIGRTIVEQVLTAEGKHEDRYLSVKDNFNAIRSAYRKRGYDVFKPFDCTRHMRTRLIRPRRPRRCQNA